MILIIMITTITKNNSNTKYSSTTIDAHESQASNNTTQNLPARKTLDLILLIHRLGESQRAARRGSTAHAKHRSSQKGFKRLEQVGVIS